MRFILNLYFSTKYIFYFVNIILAVIIPVLICLLYGFNPKELFIESIIGIIMVIVSATVLGGYESLKQGFESFKDN